MGLNLTLTFLLLISLSLSSSFSSLSTFPNTFPFLNLSRFTIPSTSTIPSKSTNLLSKCPTSINQSIFLYPTTFLSLRSNLSASSHSPFQPAPLLQFQASNVAYQHQQLARLFSTKLRLP